MDTCTKLIRHVSTFFERGERTVVERDVPCGASLPCVYHDPNCPKEKVEAHLFGFMARKEARAAKLPT